MSLIDKYLTIEAQNIGNTYTPGNNNVYYATSCPTGFFKVAALKGCTPENHYQKNYEVHEKCIECWNREWLNYPITESFKETLKRDKIAIAMGLDDSPESEAIFITIKNMVEQKPDISIQELTQKYIELKTDK